MFLWKNYLQFISIITLFVIYFFNNVIFNYGNLLFFVQELEAERTKLLEEVSSNKQKIQELEDSLLYRLTTTKGSLVEDDSLIEVLKTAKATAEDICEKLIVSEETETMINTAREEFRPGGNFFYVYSLLIWEKLLLWSTRIFLFLSLMKHWPLWVI